MVIRRAHSHDGPALFLLARAFATSFTVEQAAFERIFAEVLTHSEAFLSVAEEGEEIAGYVLGFDHPAFFANGRVAWVEEIMVSESCRQQGVGRQLMKTFEAWAAERDVKIVALATRRAAGFYQALGYEESATYYRKCL